MSSNSEYTFSLPRIYFADLDCGELWEALSFGGQFVPQAVPELQILLPHKGWNYRSVPPCLAQEGC